MRQAVPSAFGLGEDLAELRFVGRVVSPRR